MTHVSGVVQTVHAPFSREHRNVTPVSADVHVAVFVAVDVGFDGVVVSTGAGGATVSTTQVYAVGMLSVPLTTVLTLNVWPPCARAE